MSLSEIESRASALALKLVNVTTGRQEALLIGVQLEGLRDLAQIKAIADNRADHNVAVGMRERELAAMEAVAAGIPKPNTAKCGFGWSWPDGETSHFEICTEPAKHTGDHRNSVTGIAHVPTKPVADRLHELVSYFAQERGAANEESTKSGPAGDAAVGRFHAYNDAAAKLEALLLEGGI